MTAPDAAQSLRPAGLDRRFYALVLDALLLGVVFALAGLAWVRVASGHPTIMVLLFVGTALVELLTVAAFQGGSGLTPGKAALSLRLVSAEDGSPIGLGRSMVRTLIVGAAAVPTFGLGLATLAWTALSDPSGRRRGWHDQVAGSVVVEPVTATVTPSAVIEEQPAELVNLSVLRLQSPEPDPLPSAPQGRPPGLLIESAPRPPATAPAPESAAVPLTDGEIIRPPAGVRRADPRPVTWTLAFDTGEVIEVAGMGLIGRRPEPRPGEHVRHVISLPSADMSVSKTHAQFHLADGVLVVMDRGSTNGTSLIRRGVSRALPSGRPATLLDGDRVRFGDREMVVSRRRVGEP